MEAGHTVRAVARRDDAAKQLRDAGAEPVAVDLFDAAAVRDAVAGCEAVLHLATNVPPLSEDGAPEELGDAQPAPDRGDAQPGRRRA